MAALAELVEFSVFEQRASAALSAAYARGRMAALLFLDLDNFRLLNSGYGHRVGDRILENTAARIRSTLASPNIIARRGGDEFVVLLVDIPSVEVAAETAKALIASGFVRRSFARDAG
jgi:diguanylate cyclase (GGDEF)-like protein